MRKSQFTAHHRCASEQIIRLIQQQEGGRAVADICREAGISDASFFRWKARFGSMTASDVQRLRALEDENRRLKQLVAEQALDVQGLRAALAKKF